MPQRIKKIKRAQDEWIEYGGKIFRKCCIANVRLEIHADGFVSICDGDKNGPKDAGVYTSSTPIGEHKIDSGCDSEIMEDLLDKVEEVLPKMGDFAEANEEYWESVERCEALASINREQIAPKRFLSKVENLYDDLSDKLSELKRKQREMEESESGIADGNGLRNAIISADPVATGLSLPKQMEAYDNQWLESAKKAASMRQTFACLPLRPWTKRSNGSYYLWHEAIDNGRPNFIIDSVSEESLKERMKMLDNFVATMLLAYPVKQLHISVLENRTVNSFINDLPDKVCEIIDIRRDTESVDRLVKRLVGLTRAGRDNPVPDCTPKEIVVFAGYDRNDRHFSDLMDRLSDIIEDGHCAGIYFAVVLSDDYEEYTDGDKRAFEFERYFARYASLLDKNSTEDDVLPEYHLLERDAIITDEDGNTRTTTLGRLIVNYIDKEAKTTPNKVYDLIENGELYTTSSIRDLNDQPRAAQDNIVIPIAQTDNGDQLDMKMNATDFISYFILGRSGMGKSFTLHTILTNLMLKYDPSVVDIILMDFKPGGVEMNYYKDVPHVSKLLVNGADKQVAKEILQSIMKDMDCRGELFQRYDVSSIDRYNAYARNHGLEQMKHIVMLVDECQDLFKIENSGSDTNIVTEIARKGRSYGIHMVLATQTLQGADIPGDALAQFSDFLFMGCKEDDVVKCEINIPDVIKRVNTLTKGEVIYCHRAAEPVHGYIYNFAGKDGVYRDKTHDSLLSDRFSKPDQKQFYFNASQIYRLDNSEFKALADASMSGLRPQAMSVLGKNLSVKGDTMYTKFKRQEGGNLAIMGVNDLLQSERVLWNALLSLYHSNVAIENKSQYFILPTFPEDVDFEAREYNEARTRLVRSINRLPGVELVDEEDKADTIERIAQTVRHRLSVAEQDRRAVNDLDSIYLVIPNQQLYYMKTAKQPRGLTSLDSGVASVPKAEVKPQEEPKPEPVVDSWGFEGLDMGAFSNTPQEEEPKVAESPFAAINDPFSAPEVPTTPTAAAFSSRGGRNISEELRQILQNGPSVKVHVLLQTTGPDKVFCDGPMSRSDMGLFFNDMVFLRMSQTNGLPIPDTRDCQQVERLSANPTSLRAIVYNAERGIRTVVPFDFPTEETFSLINN